LKLAAADPSEDDAAGDDLVYQDDAEFAPQDDAAAASFN
jgi:hypothetical protein